MIGFQELIQVSCGAAVADAPCPYCGPSRNHAFNRKRPVFRVWQKSEDFISYHCERCGESGYAISDGAKRSSTPKQKPIQTEPMPDKRNLARFLWSIREPIKGSIAERYLRDARGYRGPLPATLGFLRANGKYEPAMIAAFAIPAEPEPGRLVVDDGAITRIHLTKLKPDGSGKAGTDNDKIMLGPSKGQPIVLAPCNDLLGLAITEGIEDALTIHELTGLGAWAAGSAGRMPALGEAAPDWIDCVSIFIDDDIAGRDNAGRLAAKLRRRGIHVEPLEMEYA